MKTRYFAGVMGLFLLITMGIVIVNAGNSGTGPILSITPSVAPLSGDTTITIMGSGFTPGQEIFIMFDDQLGVPTAIPFAPVADKTGTWSAVWKLDRYASRGIVPEGVFPIRAVDSGYNMIAATPVAFVDNTKDPKQWPEWAKAAGIQPGKKKKKK